MSRSYCIIICLFLLFTSNSSCLDKKKGTKKYSKLTLTLDSDSAFYLASPDVSAKYLRHTRIYDTTGRYSHIYQFDSVQNGPITITLQSELDTSYSRMIFLRNDSTIHISRWELPQFTEAEFEEIRFPDMTNGEKICIVVTSQGCFHDHTERSVIRRIDDSYQFDFFTNRQLTYGEPDPPYVSAQFGKNLEDSLNIFKSGILKFIDDIQSNSKITGRKRDKDGKWVNVVQISGGGLSTTTTWYRIQRGNLVYTLYNRMGKEPDGYLAVLKLIKPAWFEKEYQ